MRSNHVFREVFAMALFVVGLFTGSASMPVARAQDSIQQGRHVVTQQANEKRDPWESAFRPIEPPANPPQLPREIEAWMTKISVAAAKSAETFRPMSTQQLNHRPSDGSHTARWNAEHLAGSHVWFFSEIFHKLDPRIPVLKKMPRQMPHQYQARNPDWDGEMTARWMKASDDYCRRYAYLLADVQLNQRFRGTQFGRLGEMLKTVEWHYGNHTGNVQRKTKRSDWPR